MKSPAGAHFALWLVPILVLSCVGAFVWLQITTPSDGARLQPGELVWRPNGIVVSPLLDHPNGLRSGDIVVAVAGQSMESWARRLLQFATVRPQWRSDDRVQYTVVRAGQTLAVTIRLESYPFGVIWRQYWGAFLFALTFPLLGTFVFVKRPQERAAPILLIACWCFGPTYIPWVMGLQIGDLINGNRFWMYRVMTLYLLGLVAFIHLSFLLFPQAHPLIGKYPAFIPLLYGTPILLQLAFLLAAQWGNINALHLLGWWHLSDRLLTLVGICGIVFAFLKSYRQTTHDLITHRQIQWIVYTISIIGGGGVLFGMLPELIFGRPLIEYNNFFFLFALQIPLAFTAAIWRHHLFDIDLVVNRTLVYSTLTALVIGIYALIVSALSLLLPWSDHWFIALAATGLVAVLFQPLRERLQRTVNRLMYGERDDPYAVLSRFGQQLETTFAPEATLPTIARTIAQTLKLPYAAVALKQGEEFTSAAEYFANRDKESALRQTSQQNEKSELSLHLVKLPLVYQSENIGQLIVAQRAPDEAFTLDEQRLLQDIAHQAGVAVHAVRLTNDLQRSRERLVSAREEERRRIRRDLHDGLGPTLSALLLKVDATRDVVHDPLATDALLVELKTHINESILDIRRLVYNLRPPALDEFGLVGAVQEYLLQLNEPATLQITLDVTSSLPLLSAAVEVASYRIIQEALTNVVRHAQAHYCTVRFALENGALQLEVTDDGVGLPSGWHAGVGITAMRERVAELGGCYTIESLPKQGVHVLATLPMADQGVINHD